MERLSTPPTIAFMSTFPPTTCGIATYTTDLMKTLRKKFRENYAQVKVEISKNNLEIADFHVKSDDRDSYRRLAEKLNREADIKLIHIQHEFGLFGGELGEYLFDFLEINQKPVIFTFHTVLPTPNPQLKSVVEKLFSYAERVIVMTRKSAEMLNEFYEISASKIDILPHGTHLVRFAENDLYKQKYGFKNRLILSTFGLLGPGKGIETALYAIPELIKKHPNILYLIIGKTHPGNIKNDRDEYRIFLKKLVKELEIGSHVIFLDKYMKLKPLLELLQATDIYLFTSKDPNQAVSGTFSYAMSCGCPIIATTNPHTREILNHELGILIEIGNHRQLTQAAMKLLSDRKLREFMALQAYTTTNTTIWDNIAVQTAQIYQEIIPTKIPLRFSNPKIKLDHLKRLTTQKGMLQFAKISQPDPDSGYTLDDNSRALIAVLMHYKRFKNPEDLDYISRYLNFIESCQTSDGDFVNYIDFSNRIHIKNDYVNLEDSNARAIWALGTLISYTDILPAEFSEKANNIITKARKWIPELMSPRSIAFSIKGLYLCNKKQHDDYYTASIEKLANKLISRYDLNTEKDWKWYEEYLTYANSILPEALLLAYLTLGNESYKSVALKSFEFLLTKMFVDNEFRTISNKSWHQKKQEPERYGEQPIDVAYTIQSLDVFYRHFKNPDYKTKMNKAFNWFLGDNHLNRIIYNPVTGGCCDGLEEHNVNLNQGAESTVCYLMARLMIEKYNEKPLGKKFTKALRKRKKPNSRKSEA